MTQSLVWVAGFVLLLAMLPLGIKWVQSRGASGPAVAGAASRVLSAVAVGPQQRVVTVEVGPQDARVCLVLAVTQQSVCCLHTYATDRSSPAPADSAPPGAQSFAGTKAL
jgi:flagellar protein FliO/FliZ